MNPMTEMPRITNHSEIYIGITVKHISVNTNENVMRLKITMNFKMDPDLRDKHLTILLQDEHQMDLTNDGRNSKIIEDGRYSTSLIYSCTIPCSNSRDNNPFEITEYALKIKVNAPDISSTRKCKIVIADRLMRDFVQFQSTSIGAGWSSNGLIVINSYGKELGHKKRTMCEPDDLCRTLINQNEDTLLFSFAQREDLVENLSSTWVPAICVISSSIILPVVLNTHPEEYMVDLLMTVVFMVKAKFGKSTAIVYLITFSAVMSSALMSQHPALLLMTQSLLLIVLLALLARNIFRRDDEIMNFKGQFCRCISLIK